MNLKKFLILTLIALSGTFLFANSDKNSTNNWISGSVSIRTTYSYINPITDVDINTDPIQLGSLNVVLFPGKWNIYVGYSRTFNSAPNSNTGRVVSAKHAAEQIKIELPLIKFDTGECMNILYNHYLFNTSLTPIGNKKVWMIDKTNTTAVTGSVSSTDQGVSQLKKGQSGQLTTKINRYELRLYFAEDGFFMKHYADGSATYLSFFYEEMEKPFEDPTTTWKDDNGNKIVVVYSQVKFTSYGISFGGKRDDKYLNDGFNISKIYMDIAGANIDLTNNYSLKDDNFGKDYPYDILSVRIGGEIAYKQSLSYMHGNFIFGVYGYYNDYSIGKDPSDPSRNVDSIHLSDDYLVGVRVALYF